MWIVFNFKKFTMQVFEHKNFLLSLCFEQQNLSSYYMKNVLTDRKRLKNSWRSKILKPSKMVLPLIKSFFRLQKIHQKPFFMFFTPYWTKMWCCKKKVVKIWSKCWKTRIFENSKSDLRPKSAGNRPICGRGGPFSSKVLPKIFLSQSDKNWLTYLKIGGVRLLNVVYSGFHLTWMYLTIG